MLTTNDLTTVFAAAPCGLGDTPRAPRANRLAASTAGIGVALLSLLLTAVGCTTPVNKHAGSPLASPQLTPQSVVLDVFFLRFPSGDREANRDLWNEVDELQLPAELRQRLAVNGFRAGVVSGHLPTALAKLLEVEKRPADGVELKKVDLATVNEPPKVERRQMQLKPAVRGEIITSAVYESVPVLFRRQGELGGECYREAQGVLAVRSLPQADGRVQLEVTPELHHDQPKTKFVGDQGMFRLEAGRPRATFEELKLAATLSAGDMLLLMSLPNRPGSLGHYFLTEQGAQLDQKLLVIRLSQTQHDDLVEPSEPLKLD